MKKIYLLLLILFATSSCESFLDEMPDNRAELDTQEKIKQLLVTAYAERLGTVAQEFRSDNVDQNTIPTYSEANMTQEQYYLWENETENAGNDGVESFWGRTYAAISNANHAIEAIEKLGNPASLEPYKAEALLCRAYGHFSLTNAFCMAYGRSSDTDLGIPYMKIAEKEVSPQYTRGTVSELYKAIEEDIEAAIPNIRDESYDVPKYRFNKKAAYSFAVRFYLYYQKWDKVIEYANKVFENDPMAYLRDWDYHGSLPANGLHRADDFIDVNNRATFLVQPTYSNYGNFYYYTKYSHNRLTSDTETLHSKGPWGNFQNLKVRPITFQAPNPSTAVRKVNTYRKIANIVTGSYYPIVILAVFNADEVLLSRAEAYIHKKEYDKALADLNMFMMNYMKSYGDQTLKEATISSINEFYGKMAYYTPTKPTPKKAFNADFPIESGTQENLLHFTLHMRRILTMHEGLRMNDVKRYKIVIYRRIIDTDKNITETDEMGVDDPRRALQLPITVIQAGLEPNPEK